MNLENNPSRDEIDDLAYKLVERMTYEEKENYIAEDLIHIMGDDPELYFLNLNELNNVR